VSRYSEWATLSSPEGLLIMGFALLVLVYLVVRLLTRRR
jgi:hypothetical protein